MAPEHQAHFPKMPTTSLLLSCQVSSVLIKCQKWNLWKSKQRNKKPRRPTVSYSLAELDIDLEMQIERFRFLRLLFMLCACLSRNESIRSLCTSRKGVQLPQPGEGHDSWPRGMGRDGMGWAGADGPERPRWRGDRWQHGTAWEGDIWSHGLGTSLCWSQLQGWVRLGEGRGL